MIKSRSGGFKWLFGAVVGASLVGACGAPTESEQAAQPGAEEQATGSVMATVSTPKASLAARENVTVTVTLTNVSSQTVQLPRWLTPGDKGHMEGRLTVTRDGQAVDYIGPHYKRVALRAEDLVTLKSGESITGPVAVSGAYDLSVTGNYVISYDLNGHGGEGLVTAFQTNSVSLFIEGRASGLESLAERTVNAQSLSYSGACTSSEQSQIATAVNNAKTYSNNAYSYLTSTTLPSTRYTTWFGTYSSSAGTTIKNHYNAIKNAFANAAIVVDCSCNESGTYAYVYPGSPYKIYVCGAFWSAPATGTDSKAGTLVHEMSHFTVVAGTDDWAYGQTAAKNLARSNPANARDNADNHEYFAENTPSLP